MESGLLEPPEAAMQTASAGPDADDEGSSLRGYQTEGIGASSDVHAEDMKTDAANLEEESENLRAILENKADIHNIGFTLNSNGLNN